MSLRDKLTREIHGAYLEEQDLPESSTTLGMIELADKYAAKWKEVADEYYNKIMEYENDVPPGDEIYSSDNLHINVTKMKEAWETYYQAQCENYSNVLLGVYNRGTIKGPIFADYKYDMQKEWALELVDIYEQLGIGE